MSTAVNYYILSTDTDRLNWDFRKGALLRSSRTKKGLTRQDIVAIIEGECSNSMIRKLEGERGRNHASSIDTQLMLALCRAIDIRPEDLGFNIR